MHPDPPAWNSCARRRPSLERRKRKSGKLRRSPPSREGRDSRESRRRREPVLKSLVPGLAEEGKNGRQLLKFSSALLSRGSLCAGRNYMGAPPFGCKHAHRTCVWRWLGAEREAGCRPPRTSPAMERHPAPGENAIEYP